MVYFSRFSTIMVLIVGIVGLLLAFPNFLPAGVRSQMPGWLPSSTVNLGLDLQGGAYMLLEVDLPGAIKERMESLRGDVRTALRKAHIGYKWRDAGANGVAVQIDDPAQREPAQTILKQIASPGGAALLGLGTQEYELTDDGVGGFTLRLTDTYAREMKSQIVSQSIEVVRRRIDELGTREPTIQKQGDDRILVQVPGIKDVKQLELVISKTAKMTFQLVDEAAMGDVARGHVPPEDVLLYEKPEGGGQPVPYAVQRRVMVSGDRLEKASQDFSQQTGQPIVNFKFDSRGARQFGDATKNNVGRRFAIVLDNEVISAPVIKTAILGGSGYIEGNFTVQSAGNLAVMLNAGALPASLKIIEERTVGAELGADSIEAGKMAAIFGLLAVIVFICMSYGLFGVFATIALAVNMILLTAVLTLFQATLTLPGIAGIVLTMGMAVDANVLIYERIREELRSGKTVIAAIDAGFRRATATIIDTNMTHVLAALILFQLGVGPVRGFAVTLGIGVITSFFTAVMVTRLIVVTWLKTRRPKALTI